MKTLAATLLLFLLTLSSSAQAKKPAGTPLGNEFAKAALKALRAIDGDSSSPEMRDGEMMVNRKTQEVIDNADGEAKSKAEQRVVALLNRFYTTKLIYNLQRELAHLKAANASYSSAGDLSEGQRDAQASAVTSQDPELRSKARVVNACSAAIDSLLRARKFSLPKVCPPEEDAAE